MLLESPSFSLFLSKIVIGKGVAQGVCSEILDIFGQLMPFFSRHINRLAFFSRAACFGMSMRLLQDYWFVTSPFKAHYFLIRR